MKESEKDWRRKSSSRRNSSVLRENKSRLFPLMRSGEVAAPAIGDDQSGTEAAPVFHVLATVGNDSAVGLADGDGVASDLHGEVAGGLHADGFQAQVLVSGLAALAKQTLDGLGAVGGVVMRRHERAVLSEESGNLIVVAGVKRRDEILSKVANQGLNVQERTRIRHRAGIGPIHLLPPGGRPRAASTARWTTLSNA